MFLDEFYQSNGDLITVSAQQASRFAKSIADDFNPIHNEDAKRFCVPGDMLFSLVLSKYGLSQQMQFDFAGMVGADVELAFPKSDASELSIDDVNGKHYLTAARSGNSSSDTALIEAFVRQYVAFSGHNFPHILVPLMRSENVMINPDRPLVIYESMSFELSDLAITAPVLQSNEATIEVDGKRGDVRLNFDIYCGKREIGHGVKKLVLSGLREYDHDRMQAVCDQYDQWKLLYKAG